MPSEQNLAKLISVLCGYYAVKTNLGGFVLKIEKTVGLGNYKQGVLTLNEKLFTKPGNISLFINLLIAIFHELAHIIANNQNEEVFTTMSSPEAYLSVFYYKGIKHIFQKITNDEIIAKGITEWLYLQNENEIFAFKYSLEQTMIFLEEYFDNLLKYVPTYDMYINNKLNDILKKYPFIVGNEKNIIDMINGYQLTNISRGLNKLLNFEEKAIITSYPITFSQNVREVLIYELLKIRDENYVVKYLCNPYFSPNEKELKLLKTVYSEELLNKFIFKTQKNPKYNLSASK